MGEVRLWQASFNAGEFSPLLDAREDLQKYANSCRRLRNFHGIIQGPARRRAGSRRIAGIKSNGNAWLVPFVKGRRTAYVIELGDNYARFYKDRGQVLSSGVPYEIVTPWTYEDMTDVDGTFALRMVQSNDVIFVFGGEGVKQINRFGDTNWTITDFETVGGPFAEPNTTSTTVYASAATGSITLTASSSIFTADHVGTLMLIRPQNLSSVSPWEANQHVATNGLRRSDGKTYKMTTAGVTEADGQRVTGTVAPIHEEGTARDGNGKVVDPYSTTGGKTDSGLDWEFQDPGYGVVKITAYTSGTVVSATVQPWRIGVDARLPDAVVSSGNATKRWQFGLFGNHAEWPRAGTFFRERFVLATSRKIVFSVPASYTEFTPETAGEVLADNAFVVDIQSDRDEELQWLSPANVLHVGTTGAEHAIQELTLQQVFGPNNRKIEPYSANGSNGVSPVRVGETPMFVDASGLTLRSIEATEGGSFKSRSQNDVAEHITSSTVTQLAYAALPDSLLWGMRADGRLACLTHSAEQDVFGWSLHTIGGYRDASKLQAAKVKSICAIPSPDGTIDDIWMIVERYVDGNIQRDVEYLTEVQNIPQQWENESNDAYERRILDFQADQFYVDGGVTYDEPLTITNIAASESGVITVTCPSHGLTDGDEVRIDSVIGMWQVNARSYVIDSTGTNTFTLVDEDGTDFTPYASGGVVRELVTTFSGLEPYEGQTIDILADGAVHPSRTVVDGEIELQYGAGRVHLGYGFLSLIETQRPAGGANSGSAQGQLGAIDHVVIRMRSSLGGKIGPSEALLDDILFRKASDAMDAPPALFSGDVEMGWPDGYSTDRTVVFVQDQPLPAVIEGIGSNIQVNDS
jgi:hypothetical protein